MNKSIAISALLVCVFSAQLPASTTPGVSYHNGQLTTEGPINYCGVDTGSAVAYVCANPSGAVIQSYRTGNTYSFTASHTNTGIATLAIDGITPAVINKRQGTQNLAGGDIVSGATIVVVFDGASFELQSPTPSSAGLSAPGPGVVKSDGSSLFDATASDVVQLFGSGACSGYLKSDGTCANISSGGTAITLQTNNVNNEDQTRLNVLAGAGVTLAQTGANVTITSASSVTQPYTIATLPSAAANTGNVFFVKDGATSTDCTAGSGAFVVACKSNGSAWISEPIGQSGTLSGAASGVLTGTYPSPKFRDWVIAADYASVQAACTAAGATGTVIVPFNYSGTDKTWNCGTTQVVDQRTSNYTKWNAKQFGLVGDGAVLTDGFITGGTALLGSVGHCFVAADVGKYVKVLGGNSTGAVSVLATNDLYGTINSVGACKATLSNSSTGTGSLTALKLFFATDDSAAFQNMLTLAEHKASGTAQIYFPAGIYALSGPFYITSSMDIVGDGSNSTSLRQINPTSDLFVWKYPNTGAGETAGVMPNAFPALGRVHDINVQGEGTGTTGNLFVIAVSALSVDNVTFSGHAGTAMLQLGERIHYDHIRTRNVRRTLATSINLPANESYFTNFDLMDNGCITDSNLGNGLFYNFNSNAVNGVYPGMTAAGISDGSTGPYTIVQDPQTAIVLDGVTDFKISNGSIKTTRCSGGMTVTESNGQVEIDHIATENGTISGYIAPSYVIGGPHIHSTLASSLSSVSNSADIADGSRFDNFVGAAADASLTYYTVPGTLAYIYPPDFVFGSGTASSIGGGITQGTFETVTNFGGYHDQVGSGWHAGIGRLTGAIAWPVGAVYEQVPIVPGNVVTLDSNHIHSDSFDTGSRYSVSCNPDVGQICGEVVVGLVADRLHAWGSSLANTNSRGVKFNGEMSFSPLYANNVGGNLEIHTSGYVDSHSIQAAGLNINKYPVPNGSNTTYSIPEIGVGSQIRRAVYSNAILPFTSYYGPYTNLQFGGSAALANWPAGYSWLPQAGVGGGNFGPLLQYSNSFELGDQVYGSTTNPTNIWKFNGDSNTPGLAYQIYNPTPATYTTVFNVQGSTEAAIAANGGYSYSKISQNNGTTQTTMGMGLNNGLQILGVGTPAAPTVTATVASGSATTTYQYTVTAYQSDTLHTAASPVGTTNVGAASLSGASFNTIAWSSPPGTEASFNVCRTAGGTNQGIITATPISASGTLSFVDTGISASGACPSTNNTGAVVIGTPTNTWVPVGKLDIVGDLATTRFQTNGSTLEFTNPTSGIATLQADGASLGIAVGGSPIDWTFTSTGGLIASNATAPVGGSEYYTPPLIMTANLAATTTQQWYVCSTGTLTLPASPINGDNVTVTNVGTGVCTVNGNGFGIGNAATGNPTTSGVNSGLSSQFAFDGLSATNAWRTVTATASGGGNETVSVNGGAPFSPVSGNVNIILPTLAATGSGIACPTSGGIITCNTTAPVDTQTSNGGGYTVPPGDCTATGSTLIITGTTTMNVGISQAGLGGNFQQGCKLDIVNNSTGTVTTSFTVSTWNSVSGTNAITLAGRSGGTAHTAHVVSDGANFEGSSN